MNLPVNTSPLMREAAAADLQIATFGTGCFWCTEAIFQRIKGVKKVVSGYSGGHVVAPTYEQVCGKATGHAEVVQLMFDPDVITYADLLNIFWQVHDPTTPDRQGNDVGPQYRSVIFYHDDAQRDAAHASKLCVEQSKIYTNPIVTEIVPYRNFYSAEDYHQQYYDKMGSQNPYCRIVVRPKVEKFMKHFSEWLM